MAQKILAVIPARLGSTRFPNKVIYPFHGKPLLFYMIKELKKIKRIDLLIVATDSEKVKIMAEKNNFEVIKTSSRHKTGTDRVAEVMNKIGGDIILNIQADNYGLSASVIDRLLTKFVDNKNIGIATMAYRIDNDSDLFNPDNVKVLIDSDGNALWFSRFPLPYLQHCTGRSKNRLFPFWKHIGVYFYRKTTLIKFANWKRTTLEKAESLEQLRVLENRGSIKVFKTRMKPISIDSPHDLKKLNQYYKYHKGEIC